MQTSQLIDAVVRQTARLIAQLATTSGGRTPLADVASRLVSRTGNGDTTVYRATALDEAQMALADAERLALLEQFQAQVSALCSQLAAQSNPGSR